MDTETFAPGEQAAAPPPGPPRRRIAVNTAIFAGATALSRIAGLGREIAPAAWNLVILVLLVILQSKFHGQNRVYAYAIAWLVATVVQFAMVGGAMRRIDFRLGFVADWRDPKVRQVLILFVPVTVSIGI